MANDSSTFTSFHYDRSLAAAIIFIVLFSASGAMHGFQMLRQRAWLMVPFLSGCFCKWLCPVVTSQLARIVELIGYIAWAISCQQTPDWTLGPFIINAIRVLVAPALFAASIYMLLARLILLTDGERYSMLRRRWLTKVFVGGDILSFLMQFSGKETTWKSGSMIDQSRGWYHGW